MPNRFTVFITLILLGFFVLYYTRQVKSFTGSWNWAERIFGTGGTYTAIKLLGVFFIIFAFAYGTGHIEEIFLKYLGPIFGTK